MIICMMPSVAMAAETEIAIDETNFPDENFRTFVSENYDTDKDGSLSTEEIGNVTVIDCSGKDIANLTGIGVFTSIKELDCSGNRLSFLNVAQNTELEVLNCAGDIPNAIVVADSASISSVDTDEYKNNITYLNLSNNTKLRELNCDLNKITSLDLSNNPELVSLSCCGCALTELDVSQNHNLETLLCGIATLNAKFTLDSGKEAGSRSTSSKNSITYLNLSGTTALKEVKCDFNKIGLLDLTDSVKLEKLECGYNSLVSLDLTSNEELQYLDCAGNELASLDVSENIKLQYLDMTGNNLSSIDVSNNTQLATLVKPVNTFNRKLHNFGTQFDLSSLGENFDVSKATNWRSSQSLESAEEYGTIYEVQNVDGKSVLTLSGGGQRNLYYDYDCGNGYSATFYLYIFGNTCTNECVATANENGTHTLSCSACGFEETVLCGGGTATATKKATCSVCGEEYGTYVTRLANITGTNVTAKAGKEISVPIRLTKNTGLASMQVEIGFDDSVLKLTGVTNGEIFPDEGFVAPELDKSNVLSWQNSKQGSNITSTGVLATLTFTIKENAKVGNTKITYTCNADNEDAVDVNGKVVTVSSDDSVVNIIAFVYGDVDDDGAEVGLADVMQLRRYVAKWKGYTVNTDAADLDCNGKVSIRDVTILERYIAGWKGYETLPMKKSSLPIDDTKAE